MHSTKAGYFHAPVAITSRKEHSSPTGPVAQNLSGRDGEEKYSCPYRESNYRRPARSPPR
jgi:hypothetical protein